jgi:hypothetical protein
LHGVLSLKLPPWALNPNGRKSGAHCAKAAAQSPYPNHGISQPKIALKTKRLEAL